MSCGYYDYYEDCFDYEYYETDGLCLEIMPVDLPVFPMNFIFPVWIFSVRLELF
jgi:hypothetical protein